MKRRERILAFALAAVAACLLGYGALKAALLDPVGRIDQQNDELSKDIDRLTRENAEANDCPRRLKQFYDRVYGSDEMDVNEQMTARLMKLVEMSGLSNEQFSSSAVPGNAIYKKKNMLDREIGRSISIKNCKLSNVVNLMYLLSVDSYMHRVDAFSVSPSPGRAGEVDLTLRCFTVAMAAAGATSRPAASQAASQPVPSLGTPQRRQYEVIVSRDIFRPYAPHPIVEPPKPARSIAATAPVEQWANMRLTGLPVLFGIPTVCVLDGKSAEVHCYRIGQTLAGGNIIMIDYRQMPRADNPRVFSDSRVVLQYGRDYWAVEIGDRLADKYILSPLRLPEELRSKKPAGAPASPLAGADKRNP